MYLVKTLLSILIPTYNRSKYLQKLLEVLEDQLKSVESMEVEVLIGDNSSNDSTVQVASVYVCRNRSWQLFKRESNLGFDANLFELFKIASGAYIWVIGDDDLPRSGLIPLLLYEIVYQRPTLIYLPSTWSAEVDIKDLPSLLSFSVAAASRLDFARSVNIWTTFVSSWVVSADELLKIGVTMDEVKINKGSSFIQLGWIMPLLMHGNPRFLRCIDTCILATSGNTGGYGVLLTFCINYPFIISHYAKNSFFIKRALLDPFVFNYLPTLILDVRKESFKDERYNDVPLLLITRHLWSYPGFWIFCLPLLALPLPIICKLIAIRKSINVFALNATRGVFHSRPVRVL